MARAYLDQLQRANAVSDSVFADVTVALDRVDQLGSDEQDRQLAKQLNKLGKTMQKGGADAITKSQKTGLGKTLREIASRIKG